MSLLFSKSTGLTNCLLEYRTPAESLLTKESIENDEKAFVLDGTVFVKGIDEGKVGDVLFEFLTISIEIEFDAG
jgi:hypothetical protein